MCVQAALALLEAGNWLAPGVMSTSPAFPSSASPEVTTTCPEKPHDPEAPRRTTLPLVTCTFPLSPAGPSTSPEARSTSPEGPSCSRPGVRRPIAWHSPINNMTTRTAVLCPHECRESNRRRGAEEVQAQQPPTHEHVFQGPCDRHGSSRPQREVASCSPMSSSSFDVDSSTWLLPAVVHNDGHTAPKWGLIWWLGGLVALRRVRDRETGKQRILRTQTHRFHASSPGVLLLGQTDTCISHRARAGMPIIFAGQEEQKSVPLRHLSGAPGELRRSRESFGHACPVCPSRARRAAGVSTQMLAAFLSRKGQCSLH